MQRLVKYVKQLFNHKSYGFCKWLAQKTVVGVNEQHLLFNEIAEKYGVKKSFSCYKSFYRSWLQERGGLN